ncbi:hypothetical protein H2136_20205 [Aeromonas hydrophila]|uniref:Uncharacterized protein n=1 Tax=Aeromonas hydrophila TaxID=644 RepID=A0A926ITU2_AERHY|nr:hypothetical protein [Aeromonas hydrophila]
MPWWVLPWGQTRFWHYPASSVDAVAVYNHGTDAGVSPCSRCAQGIEQVDMPALRPGRPQPRSPSEHAFRRYG